MNDSRLVSELLKATKILEVRSQDREVTGLVMWLGTHISLSLSEETTTRHILLVSSVNKGQADKNRNCNIFNVLSVSIYVRKREMLILINNWSLYILDITPFWIKFKMNQKSVSALLGVESNGVKILS